MQLARTELTASVLSLIASSDVHNRCIGHNYYVEENVGDVRRDAFEAIDSTSADIRQIAKTYFDATIQGVSRGHLSSTFDTALNRAALLPATIDPNQKIVRLERIDRLLSRDPDLTLDRLRDARIHGDVTHLQAFVDLFLQYPGERPSFAAFKSEVEYDLKQADWLQRIIDRVGLYHHYPYDPDDPAATYSFALMEYSVKDVLEQGSDKGLIQPFAIAAVLECQDNSAFFPVPRGSSHGFTVDLRERNPAQPTVREILHIRFDYRAQHIARLEQWTGNSLPDIQACRDRHLGTLRTDTGRPDFGGWPA